MKLVWIQLDLANKEYSYALSGLGELHFIKVVF